MPERRSITAVLAATLGLASLTLAVAGPLAVQLGILTPVRGFRFFALGLVSGVIPLVLGGIGLLLTRGGARGGRPKAWLGTALGGGLVALFLVLVLPTRNLPRINDITTSPDDPPTFEQVAQLEANLGRDLAYPGEAFASPQRQAYPDLETIRLAAQPHAAFASALRAAETLGWSVVASDADRRRLEATETSTFFRFVDDVVVRVRAAPGGGSLVDVRSKSRDGRHDFGANAARIRAFRDALATSGAGA